MNNIADNVLAIQDAAKQILTAEQAKTDTLQPVLDAVAALSGKVDTLAAKVDAVEALLTPSTPPENPPAAG